MKIKSFKIVFVLTAFLINVGFAAAQVVSSANGAYNANSTWSGSAPGSNTNATVNHEVSVTADISTKATVLVNTSLIDNSGSYQMTITNSGLFEVVGVVTFGGALNVRNSGTVIVRNGAVLTVGDGSVFEQTSTIIVEEGGQLIVIGDLSLENSNSSQIDGLVSVSGDLSAMNGAIMSGDGAISVAGSISISNGSTLFGFDKSYSCTEGCGLATGCASPTGTNTTQWLGNSTDWNNSSNWSNGIPDSTKLVEIPSSVENFPEISNEVYVFNVSLLDGASLILEDDVNLHVYGSMTIGNTPIVTNNSTVTFHGSCALSSIITSISPVEFYNLNILTQKQFVNASAGINIRGTLTVENNPFYTNNALTLVSIEHNQAGSIGALTDGASIIGDVTANRYYSVGGAGYRSLSTPFSNSTIADWNDDFYTYGFAGSDYPDYSYKSIYYYDETELGLKEEGWLPPSNVTDNIVAGKGYLVYDYNPTNTVDLSGTINQGDFTFDLTFTDDPDVDNIEDGFNLVGNPYPSTIDWLAGDWTKSGVNNAVYVWDGVNQRYTSYVNGVGANNGSRYVPSGQAFWVQTNANNPELTITEECKSNERGSFYRQATPLALKVAVSGVSAYSDEAVINIDSNATKLFDSNFDALKMKSSNASVPNVYTLTSTAKNLSINSFSKAAEGDSINLVIEVQTNGTYQLDFSDNTTNETYLFLEDKSTNELFDLNINPIVSRSLVANTTTSRFRIIMGVNPNGSALPIELGSFTGVQKEDIVELEWTTYTEVNNDYFEIERLDENGEFEAVTREKGAGTTSTNQRYSTYDYQPLSGDNIYRLKQVDKDGTFTYSQLVRVRMESKELHAVTVNIYPNPIKVGSELTIMVPQQEQNIELTIMDLSGRIVLETIENSSSQNIRINTSALSKGNYIISISSEKISSQQKITVIR